MEKKKRKISLKKLEKLNKISLRYNGTNCLYLTRHEMLEVMLKMAADIQLLQSVIFENQKVSFSIEDK